MFKMHRLNLLCCDPLTGFATVESVKHTPEPRTLTAECPIITVPGVAVTVPAEAPYAFVGDQPGSCCEESTHTLEPLSPVYEEPIEPRAEIIETTTQEEFTEAGARDALTYLLRLAASDPDLLRRTALAGLPQQTGQTFSYEQDIDPSVTVIGALSQTLACTVNDRLDRRYNVTVEASIRMKIQGVTTSMTTSDVNEYNAHPNSSGVLADGALDLI